MSQPSRTGRVLIGTSGWSYPHWKTRFYPEGLPNNRQLAYYAAHFRTVEINATFYRLANEASVRAWRCEVPDDFTFACKMSRFVTHMKKLKDPVETLPPFFDRMRHLGPKLGPILVQLPPKWRFNAERLEAFLAALPSSHDYAFEFRDPTWWTGAVYALLHRHNAAFCSFDLAGAQSPVMETASFAYIRLHGPGGAYQGSYDDAALQGQAERIRNWQARGLDVYAYFDNDQNAYAVADAKRLADLVYSAA